jgi:lactate permease
MLPATYQQPLDPLNSFWLSALVAALPVVVLFWCLVPARWLAPRAGLAGAVTAVAIAVLAYGMPLPLALGAFTHGALFGLLPVGWTIFTAMLLYNLTVETGQFAVVRRSVAGLSGDARIQAILIAFAFGAFLEGAAGGGTPVAICGAILVGLGFHPFKAAVLCLIANTSPVAYGGLGTPLIVLAGVTNLPGPTLSVMAGHQLPLMSCLVPAWMVVCLCGWRKTWEVWPALAVAGGSFAVFQYTFATAHVWTGVELWPLTDIGGGIFALLATALLLRFWRPKKEWHFADHPTPPSPPSPKRGGGEIGLATFGESSSRPQPDLPPSPLGGGGAGGGEVPLTARSIARAWMPFALMSVCLFASGMLRQEEGRRKRDQEPPPAIGPLQTWYAVPIPGLDRAVYRAEKLRPPEKPDEPERAEFEFVWLTAPGTAVGAAAVLAMLLLGVDAGQVRRVLERTAAQMRIPIPTIALMLGLSYVTRYAGMDATLGLAFSETGMLYPFFAALLGWLGVFLTGTDAGSNALFGSLQKITATALYHDHTALFAGLGREQVQVLICTANSTGGVMGKMIDAQSICVATAATHQVGREADIFKGVVWHSIALAALVGLLVLLQAYVWPFTLLVP